MAAEVGHLRVRRAREGALGPLAKARLAVEVLVAYRRAKRALRRGNLPGALTSLRRPAGGRCAAAPPDPAPEARRLARATLRTLGVLPLDSRCLTQALTLIALLSRRGIAGELVIGVRPGVEFGAHAWVEHGALPLLPVGDSECETLVRL